MQKLALANLFGGGIFLAGLGPRRNILPKHSGGHAVTPVMQNDLPSDRPAGSATPHLLPDEVGVQAPNPQRQFQSPEMLVADSLLLDMEKHDLLLEWELDLDSRLKAEEEGMSASDPIHNCREAKLANEATRVKTCLAEIAAKLAKR